MVTQSTRPRRATAVEAVKRATQTLNGKSAVRKAVVASGSGRGTASSRKKAVAPSPDPASESGNESSDLSDLDGGDREEQDEDDAEEVESELDQSESEVEAEPASDYEEGSKAKRKRTAATSKSKGPKAKKAKKAATAPKTPRKAGTKKATSVRRAGAGTKQAGSKEELSINEDSKLFNQVKDSESDLQITAEEWVATYQDDPALAMAQLINFIFRGSACNATIDEIQVMDHDNITDTLDEIQEDLRKVAMPSYPLVSKAVSFRKFRRQLSIWIEKLFTCVDEAEILYDDSMMETLTAWISAMSSSAIRSIRHTSTYTVLVILEQINRISKDNGKEIEATEASRDAEKRKGSAGDKDLIKNLEAKVKQSKETRKLLTTFHQELLDTVFIHRYRDSDPLIRAECIGELGRWMKKYPDQYLSSKYFRYFGWMLSDQNEKVRLASIKSLDALYTRHEYTGSLQDFTERFHERMMEMATIDVDVQVRVAAISTLTHIDQQDALEEEAADSLSLHIFDVEPKVRSITAVYVKGRLDELLKEVEANEDEDEMKKLRWKHTAEMLSRLGKALDESEQADRLAIDATLTSGYGDSAPSRVATAISALWSVDEALQDASPLIELLLYDHSEQSSQGANRRRKGNTRDGAVGAAPPNEDYRLEAEEETILLEALGFIVKHAKSQAASGTEDVEGAAYSDITRKLTPVFNKLFSKYKTESSRIIEVLDIVRDVKMDSYVEYQQLAAFEALWDDVIDQFQRHSEPLLLGSAVQAIVALSSTEALNDANSRKMSFLQELVLQQIREALTDAESDEQDQHSVAACVSKTKHLIQSIDLSADLSSNEAQESNNESDNDATLWQILLNQCKKVSEGRGSDALVICDSIVILSLCIMWSLRNVAAMEEGEVKTEKVDTLYNQRAALIEILSDIVKDTSNRVSSAVKKTAFQQLVDLYILFASVGQSSIDAGGDVNTTVTSLSSLEVKCSAEAQEGLATFVRAEIRRFAFECEDSNFKTPVNTQATDTQEEEIGEAEAISAKGNNGMPTLSLLKKQMDFVSGIAHYIGAIRLGIVHARFSASLLSYFGRFGAAYDACLRVLVETIRLVGIQEGRPDQACSIVIESLWQAHHLYCEDGDASGEANLVNLGKMLSSALVIRGAQLAITKSVDGEAIKKMHSKGIRMTLEKLNKSEEEEHIVQTLVFFKVLSQLLVSVGPREAVTIKREMDNLISEYGVDVPLTSKVWDPLRQYEKRLVTIASKSDSVKKHVEANKAKKSTVAAKPSQTATIRDTQEVAIGLGDEDIIMNEEESFFDADEVGDETRQEHHIDLTIGEQEDDDGEDDDEEEADDEQEDDEEADASGEEEE